MARAEAPPRHDSTPDRSGETIATGMTAEVLLTVGSHSIDLEVTDGSATTRVTLSVRVLLPGDAVRSLADRVDLAAMHDLHHGVANALRAKLGAAAAAFDRDSFAVGVSHLESFLSELTAQRGKKVAEALADELAAMAQRIIDAVDRG